jgi:hypothetical protein
VTEQVSDHIDAGSGVSDVAAAGMPQLVRADRRVQPSPAGGGGHQLSDRVRAHRRAERLAEQVDEHEIAVRGLRHLHALERVGVKGLHDQKVQRHRALPAGLGPGAVRVFRLS